VNPDQPCIAASIVAALRFMLKTIQLKRNLLPRHKNIQKHKPVTIEPNG
jgi:hypothetical protein